MIPPFVRASLGSLGVPSAGEVNASAGPPSPIFSQRIPELSLATTGTHDTDTLAEWWNEAPADERERMLALLAFPAASAHHPEVKFNQVCDAMLAALYAAPSRLVMIPIQDLFGWRERINLPGTVGFENWSWRLPLAIEDMEQDSALAARIAQLREMAMRGGR